MGNILVNKDDRVFTISTKDSGGR